MAHYSHVIMGVMASQITSLTIVYSPIYSGSYKKALRQWPLCGEFTGFPAQMTSKAENVSIWWRHHAGVGLEIIWETAK